MNLYSDFCQDKWINKGEVPTDLTAAGYQPYAIFRSSKQPDHFAYYCTNEVGDPCTLLLYGASNRDPLNSIGHCHVKTVPLNGNEVATSIVVDFDCVEIRGEFLKSLHPDVQMKTTKRKESISLTLLSDLERNHWDNKGEPPKDNAGYSYYSIRRNKPDNVLGLLSYYLAADDGQPVNATLKGARRDPLRGLNGVYLKIDETNSIKGIINNKDWVVQI